MKRLIDYTKFLRSKNAGPLFITFDLIFESEKNFDFVLENLTKEQIAKAYEVNEEKIEIIPYKIVNSIKITFPRKNVSGSKEDTDIYGCQQHMPLANIQL